MLTQILIYFWCCLTLPVSAFGLLVQVQELQQNPVSMVIDTNTSSSSGTSNEEGYFNV